MAGKGDTIIVVSDTTEEIRPQGTIISYANLMITKTKEWEAQNFLEN